MRRAIAGARAAGFAWAALVLAGASGCAQDRGQPVPEPASTDDRRAAGDAADGESIFNLDLPLVDQDDTTMALHDLKGHPILAAMVYTSCKDVCILVTEQMKAIERQLAGADGDVQYVLFSLDPARDSPAAMREFARVQKLDTAKWRLVATGEEGVRDLAAVFGVRYQPEEDGEIAHSAVIVVIDGRGVVRHRQVGVARDARELAEAMTRARG
jgi:protein SCO1/2